MRLCMGMLTTSGGSSILSQELGKGLQAHGVDVHYCHLNRKSQDPDQHFILDAEPGLRTSRMLDVPESLGGGIEAATGLLNIFKRRPFDLFHLHSLQVFGFPALMLKQLQKVPYIVTCHGSDVLSEHLMDANRDVVAGLLQQAAAVTCVSHHVAEILQRKIPGLNHVSVIPNFLRAEWTQQPHKRQPEAARFLHVSSLRPVKRPELLLDTFRCLRTRLPSAKLAVVSTHEGGQRLHQLLESCPDLAADVEFFNGVEAPANLSREYARAAAMILTSRFEGFGLVLLEALAHGLPVVAPAVGAIPEVLGADWPLLVRDDNPAGLSAAMARAADGFAVSPERMTQVLDRYDGQRQVSAYAELYTKILGPTADSTPKPIT